MWPAQAPVPDPSALKDLNPAVAITFLVVFCVVTVAFFFQGVIKDRLGGKDKPPTGEQAAALTASPAGPVAAPAVSAQSDITDRYIASLDRRIEELEREVAELRKANETLRFELERARAFPPRWQG